MTSKEFTLRRLLLVVTLVVAPIAAFAREPPPAPPESPYAGDAACQPCHAAIYDAWAKTKHARALNVLGSADLENTACVGCHVTGSEKQIAGEGPKPSNPGVQCEAWWRNGAD